MKQMDYVDASIGDAIELAEKIVQAGGRLGDEMAANEIGRSPKSSGYATIRNAAVKLGLVDKKEGALCETELGRQITYIAEEDKMWKHRMIFLSVPLYAAIAKKFLGRRVPEEKKDSPRLSNILVLEYKIPANIAKRVAARFVADAGSLDIMDKSNNIVASLFHEQESGTKSLLVTQKKETQQPERPDNCEKPDAVGVDAKNPEQAKQGDTHVLTPENPDTSDGFGFHIWSPGGKGYRGEIGKKGYFALLGAATEMEAEFEGEIEPFQKFRGRGLGKGDTP